MSENPASRRRPAWRGPTRGHRSRPRRLVTACVLAMVAVMLAVAGALVVTQAGSAHGGLIRAAELLHHFERQLQDRDIAGARQTLITLESETAKARNTTDGFDWRMATHLPGIGDDVGAVRTMAEALDNLAQDVLPALTELAATLRLGDLVPQRGTVALARLQQAAPTLARVDQAVAHEYDRIAAIDLHSLVGPLRPAVTQFAQG